MGGSKSGTSFMVNNIAHLLAEKEVNVAILDATENKSSYYIYTKNEEILRKNVESCIEKLANKEADGIIVNQNLTVYTTTPGENQYLQEVEPILETLLKKHSLILIDCDFKTPINYFEYVSELYLVQTMDVLTIQPLTEALSKLKNKGMLDESKLRIIINKFIAVKGITEKEIIGGMSYYNDPSMAYMKELFNKIYIKYMTIPFNEQVYQKYLLSIANCNITLNEYPHEFRGLLEQLGKNVYDYSIKS